MKDISKLEQLLNPVVAASGALIEEITITPAGKRRVVTVLVDHHDRNLSLDEVTSISRAISEQIDGDPKILGDKPFTLEVSSPGVDRPLRELRHWRKNIGRLVKITLNNGATKSGRISGCGDLPEVDNEPIDPTEIKRAVIEIEFNRKGV
jgi:ribosome maturation factor RimP